MKIRLAKETDIETIKKIYENARAFMAQNGNPDQWTDGYPDEHIIKKDMEGGHCYLVEDEDGVQGVFVFIIGEEPTYQHIDGAWHQNQTYGTIHRIASTGKRRGFAAICFDDCRERIDYLRIDTHPDNQKMLAAIEKYGFQKCGIIQVRNGERIAFDYLKS